MKEILSIISHPFLCQNLWTTLVRRSVKLLNQQRMSKNCKVSQNTTSHLPHIVQEVQAKEFL
jgi:hypothetical protein